MKRAFTLFGFSHFIALSIITALMVFILVKLQTVDPEKLKKRLNPLLVILILTQVMMWRIIFLFQNGFSLTNDLPFHLCGISQILLIIYLIKPNKKLFNVLYYWIMSGSTLGVIIPDLKLDFPSARYFSMFLPHSLLVFIMLYLLLVQKNKPAKGSVLHAFVALNIYAIFLIPINLITKGNYLFLSEIPVVDFGPVEWLPEWPWYLLILEIFFIGLYRLLYQPFTTAKQSETYEEQQERLSPEQRYLEEMSTTKISVNYIYESNKKRL